jgi:hypothetical protein
MSKIEVNEIDKQNGSTLTLGGSGTAVTLACGATQTGFGRTGTVNWDTTIKTTDFTATSGSGFFVNTGGGSNITVTLPASPSAGDIVSVADYAGTAGTNKIIIARNGSNIEGTAVNSALETNRDAITLIFADSTQGWIPVNDNTGSTLQSEFVAATGGNATITSGNFKTHIFTGPGTFCVSDNGNAAGSNTVDYFVVAGGGGTSTGGGGAGGFRVSNTAGCVPSGTMSPLSNTSGLPVSVQGYPIVVGGGGAHAYPGNSSNGSNSSFSSITSAGGGFGQFNDQPNAGGNGGSGGGGGRSSTTNPGGGTGNTPPVSPPQGQNGASTGASASYNAGSGGGAGGAATPTPGAATSVAGIGSFVADAFIGPTAPSYGEPGPVSNTRYFAGGGGGGMGSGCNAGGIGGGGDGNSSAGNSAVANTGGGAGGGGGSPDGGSGGSGIVILRYKFQ